MIDGVIVDLDDTLYPQADFLDGAWRAVAALVDDFAASARLLHALRDIAAEGSDRGRIIDRALVAAGIADHPARFVDAFRSYAPARLTPFPGAVDALAALRRRFPVALVTDGDPAIQRAKLRALGLESAFDEVVLSDDLGREFRKPHPAPFLTAAARLGLDPRRCIAIGDRPAKDGLGAQNAGLYGAVRVRAGEYVDQPDRLGCLASLPSFLDAATWVLTHLESTNSTPAAATPTSIA